MRLLDGGWDDIAVEAWVDACVNLGITTFDHADIYGDYRVLEVFGRVLRRRPDLRRSIQLVSKAGIRLVSRRRPDNRLKSYDSSAAYLVESVRAQLAALNVDHLDVFLLHRPDPLLDADEVASAFDELRRAGAVRHFGVSNFTPAEFDLLASRTELVTNQVQHSLLHLAPLQDGTLADLQRRRVRPMFWSPLGGGELLSGESQAARRIRIALDDVARERGCSPVTVAYAWLLREPCGAVPVVSSSRAAGLREAAAGTDLELDRPEWFALLAAASGQPVA